jgi:undecaprenyl-diphosphatase
VDNQILQLVNRGAGISPDVDYILAFLVTRSFLKGAVVVALLWWSFAGPDSRLRSDVHRTVAGLVGAIALGRLLQQLLPFHARPIHDASTGVLKSQFLGPRFLDDYSSMPSDHAVMLFAIATAIWLRDRRWGLAAYLWVLLVGGVPRIALGLHYPSDVAVGAVVGVATMAAAHKVPLPAFADRAFLAARDRHPGAVMAALFLLSYCAATMFDDVREILRIALRGIAKLVL